MTKTHGNTGKRNAAKQFKTLSRTMRFAESDWKEFERLAGGKGRILNKWILQKLKS